MKSFCAAIFLLLSFSLISCEGSLQFEELNHQGKAGDTMSPLNWDMVNRQIAAPYCALCHRSYSNYSSFYADRFEILDLVIKNEMPLRLTLPANLKLKLQEWVDQGAPEF